MLFSRFFAPSAGRLAVGSILFLAQAFAQQLSVESFRGRDAVAREVLVKFRTPEGLSEQQAAGNLQQATQLVQGESVQRVGRRGAMRIRSRALGVTALVNQLRQNSAVEWAEPNYIIHATDTTPNDPMLPNQWSLKNTGQTVGLQTGFPLKDIGAVQAWDSTVGSPSIAVGILDSGIDYTHPDLAGNTWTATAPYSITIGSTTVNCPAGSHGFNVRNLTCDPMDDNAHGSHVAGTIGAVGNNSTGITGVNWKTSMVAIKFLSQYGSGSEADAVNAIEAALQLKAQGVNIRVLNASWGGGATSTPLRDAIIDARAADVLFVAAAGNDSGNADNLPYYPAAYPLDNIISVAATDNRDNLAGFSNFGPISVDLGAPGVDILSTVLVNDYVYGSGTSMATPHVTGAAALILSACTLDGTALRNLIFTSVDLLPALAGKSTTGGRLNVSKALSTCMAVPHPDFTLSSTPGNVSLVAPGFVESTINVTAVGGFVGPVTLSATGMPAGVTATFTPAIVTGGGSSTLKFTATLAGVTPGVYPVVVNGVSAALSAVTSVSVKVTTKDFVLSAPVSSVTIPLGGSGGTSITVNPLLGFTGTVDMSIDGLPPHVMAGFAPPNVLNGSGSPVLTISVDGSAVKGVYPLVIHGISGALVRSYNLSLSIVPPPDFELSVNPDPVPIGVGSSNFTTVATKALFNFSGNVALTIYGLPSGVTAAFAPATIPGNGSSKLTLTASASPALGSFPISVLGTSGALAHATQFTIVVQPALPKITISAPASINAGDEAQIALFLSKSADTTGVTIDLANSNSGAGALNLTSTFIPGGQSSSGKARIKGVAAGLVTITATAFGYQSASAQIQVIGGGVPPLAITTGALVTGQAGTPYSQQLQATGGTGAYHWTVIGGVLPTGFNLTPTGLLTGSPAAAIAPTPLTFQVTDSGSPVQTKQTTLSLSVIALATPFSITATAGTPQTTGINSIFSTSLSATVRDSGGMPLSGIAVTFTAPAPAGPSGSFAGSGQSFVAMTNFMGIASVNFSANGNAGSYVVTAKVASIVTPASFNLTNSIATGPKITLSISSSIGVGGSDRLAVFLAAAAPAGGLTVTVLSSNSGIGTLNLTSMFIPEGQSSSGRAVLTGVSTGMVTLSASAPGYMPGSINVQITP